MRPTVKKLDPFSFEHNFRICCPILRILLLQTEVICPQTHNLWIIKFPTLPIVCNCTTLKKATAYTSSQKLSTKYAMHAVIFIFVTVKAVYFKVVCSSMSRVVIINITVCLLFFIITSEVAKTDWRFTGLIVHKHHRYPLAYTSHIKTHTSSPPTRRMSTTSCMQKNVFTHASIMRCRARDCPMCARSHALYVPWRRRARSVWASRGRYFNLNLYLY